PPSPNQVQRALPTRPFLVVTTMTPLVASVPYNVAADGPFTISMSSISSGLRPLRLELETMLPPAPAAVNEPELKRTPSTTQIGALLSDSELTPRIRIVGAVPVMLPGSTMTPGALPTISEPMSVTGDSSTRF